MINLHPIDLALFIFCSLGLLRGAWRGAFRELLGIAAIAGGTAVSIRFAPVFFNVLQARLDLPGPPEVTRLATFVGVFAAVSAIAHLIGYGIERRVQSTGASIASSLGGSVFGGCKSMLVAAVGLLFLSLFAPPVAGRIEGTRFAKPLVEMFADKLRVAVGICRADRAG